jgi:hypothetical protein
MRTLDNEERAAVEAAICELNERGSTSLYPDYSGRGMYGSQCFGIETSLNRFEVGVELALALAAADGGDMSDLARELATDARTDSMGLGTIIYFPAFEWGTQEDWDDESVDPAMTPAGLAPDGLGDPNRRKDS